MCGTCTFGMPLANPSTGDVAFGVRSCRRFPPQPLLIPVMREPKLGGPPQAGFELKSFWPTVGVTDVCGEHPEIQKLGKSGNALDIST